MVYNLPRDSLEVRDGEVSMQYATISSSSLSSLYERRLPTDITRADDFVRALLAIQQDALAARAVS